MGSICELSGWLLMARRHGCYADTDIVISSNYGGTHSRAKWQKTKTERWGYPLLPNKAATFSCFDTSQFARLFAREPKPLRWRRMEDSVKKLQAEFVDLLRKQVEALELDAYVGLTDEERSEYYERQERIRDLDAKMSESSDRAA
jgi:hypothetical protein